MIKKFINLFFPKEDNIIISLLLLPLKLPFLLAAIVCYLALSPIFLLNGIITFFSYLLKKIFNKE